MIEPRWDGKLLKFSVLTPDGRSIAFEMRLTGEGTAELRRPEQDDTPELTMAMKRAR